MGKQSSEKSAKNFFLYPHEYRDQKMGGGKNARDNFSRNTRIVRAKNVGKNRMKKVRKNDFLYLHEYRDQKMGEKTRETIFHEHTYSAGKKCWEKIVGKRREKGFLYSHEYRDQKMEGKKHAKNFSRNTQYCEQKMLGKNRRKKVRKTFFIFTRV